MKVIYCIDVTGIILWVFDNFSMLGSFSHINDLKRHHNRREEFLCILVLSPPVTLISHQRGD